MKLRAADSYVECGSSLPLSGVGQTQPLGKRQQAAALHIGLALLLCVGLEGTAAEGDWPEPRQNARLTALQALPGAMATAPEVIARYDLGRTQPSVTSVAIPDGSGHVGLAVVAGALHCFDTAGGERWRSHPPGLNFTRVVAAEDFNGDGVAEVLLQAGRPAEPYGAAVLVDPAEGTLRWRYDVEPMSYAWYLYAGSYLPEAPGKQIVVIMQGYRPDKDNGYMALFDWEEAAATPQMKWRYDFHDYTCFPSFLQSDLDGDGVRELVVETHSRMWFLDALTGEMKHFARWDPSPGNSRSYGHIEFVDLNADGREDFLCIADFSQHHEVLLNKDGVLEMAWHYGWGESVTTGKVATTWPSPPYADVDGDGRLEIVVSMYNSEEEQAWLVRVYDALSGDFKYRYAGVRAVQCADLNGDGVAEILGNATGDATRTQLDGAVVLAVRDGALKAVWQDADATALERAGEAARVRNADGVFTLNLESDTAALTPWSPPAAAPGPDFSRVPAIAGPPLPVLLAADVTHDGVNEIIAFQEPKVTVLRLDGDALEGVAEYTSSSVPVPADLDGDGILELVLSTVTPTASPVVVAITPALDNRPLWRCTFPAPERAGLPASRKAYLRALHLTGKATPDIYAWAGTPMVRSAGIEGNSGEILWDKGEGPQPGRYWGPSMNYASAFDFNGDGCEDLVFTNPDYYCIADGPTGGPLLGPLFPPQIFDQPSQGLYTYPAILAADSGLPTVALVAGHYFQAAMSLRAAPYWYTLPVVGENRAGFEAFFPTAEGLWRMGVGRQNGDFACINAADGALRWELPLEATASDIIAGDVDGDGHNEFVCGTSHGHLVAVGDGDDAPRVVWQKYLGAGVGAPILADVDGDGAAEVICATTDGYIQVLDGN